MPEATPEFLKQCTRIKRAHNHKEKGFEHQVSETQDYSGAFICRNNKHHAIAANKPKAQQLWTDPTNRTKFLQCDYEYINTKCEHLVHWWNYVKPPLGKIQPKEPRPQPFRQPLSKHSAASTSQYSSVSSEIRSTISHVSDRGRQWTSNIIQRSIAIHPFQRPHPSTAGVLECHWIRSRPQPLSSPTLALSLIRCNASSVGIWPA